MANDREITESIQVDVPVSAAYAAVADMSNMPTWSPECARVLRRRSGPSKAGDRFVGVNRIGWRVWPVTGQVVTAEPDREFAFAITSMGMAVARWTYRFEPSGNGTTISETWQDQRTNPIIKTVSAIVAGVKDRSVHNRLGMMVTLERIRDSLEASARSR